MGLEQSKYSKEQLQGFGFRTIAVIVLGNDTFLLKQNDNALIALEPIDARSQRDYFAKEVDHLATANQIQIPGVDATQIDMVQLIAKRDVGAKWIEKTSGPDEATFSVAVTDCLNFSESPLDITEDELIDLFVPTPGKKRSATFFIIDTSEQEVVGIALRRGSPKLILLPPAIEGTKLSTIGGLTDFFSQVYSRLIEHATQLQSQLDNLVFEATLPSKRQITFAAEATNARQLELHKKILQIQGLLTSLQADPNLGLQDPRILALLPIFKADHKQNGGLKNLFGNKPAVPSTMTVDSGIWEDLNEKPGQGFITTAVRPVRPVVQSQPVRPQPQSVRPQSQPQPSRVETRPAPQPVRQPQPVAVHEAPRPSDRETALLMAKVIEEGLQKALVQFSNTTVADISLKQVVEMDQVVQAIACSALTYTETRKRGKPPENPSPSHILPIDGVIHLAGTPDAATFNFLTGADAVTDYKQKIEAAFSAWQEFVLPLFKNTAGKTDRLLSSIIKNNDLAVNNPKIKSVLIPQLISYVRQTHQKEAYTGELSHVVLMSQVIFVLLARFQELKRSQNAVEIDNWANYCFNTMERAKQLVATIQKR